MERNMPEVLKELHVKMENLVIRNANLAKENTELEQENADLKKYHIELNKKNITLEASLTDALEIANTLKHETVYLDERVKNLKEDKVLFTSIVALLVAFTQKEVQ